MEVIHRREKEKWRMKIICPYCKSTLVICEKDLNAVNTAKAFLGEDWEPRIRTICVVCKEKLYLKNIPYEIEKRLHEKLRKKEKR